MKKWLDELNELKKELENERNSVSENFEKNSVSQSIENNNMAVNSYTEGKNIPEKTAEGKLANLENTVQSRYEFSNSRFQNPQAVRKKEEASIHNGHRSRMRNKILNDELENFPPHEILETLLFYCIPRRNTNPLAHKLLDHFSSLKNILDADYPELKRCGIISEQTAFYLYFIGKLIKYYNITFENKKIVFKNLNDYKDYLNNYFKKLDNEIMVLLFLDCSNKLIGSKKIEGNKSEVLVTPKKIVELAIHSDCKKLIIAHNHPNNNCKPSVADRNLTLAVHNALNLIDVELLDHLIYGKDNFYSFRLEKDFENINKF